MKTAFITGVAGQDGSYLAKFLLEKGYKVVGYDLPPWLKGCENHRWLGIKVNGFEGDVRDPESIAGAIKSVVPDEIYHLSGFTSPRESWKDPVLVAEVNIIGTLRLFEAARQYAPKARVYNACSSEVFGDSHRGGIQTAKTPMHPKNPYATTKEATFCLAHNYNDRYKMFIVNGLTYSHESPLRSDVFITRKITKAVAKIACGLDGTLRLGNLDSVRDWGFAGDYVEAMWLTLQKSKPADYVICTGKHHTIKDFVTEAFNAAGITDWHRYVQEDKTLIDPTTVRTLKGSLSDMERSLRWTPRVQFKELVSMMVEADIRRLQAR
jgi:GDPmannose 4,6-dehydratase